MLLGCSRGADSASAITRRRAARSRSVELPPHYALRGEDGLVRAYDFILDARFDQVDAELRRACGPAPPEACDVLDATALWWRILLDPESRALDDEFSAAVERAIRTTEAWTERAPDDAEAWFYLGGAYAARVQWRVLRDEKLAAARDGKRIKQALERADRARSRRSTTPTSASACTRYYADVAPAAAKILRFLLLLPGGDRKEGLRADAARPRRAAGCCRARPTTSCTSSISGTSGRRRARSSCCAALHARYPGNPLFLAQIARDPGRLSARHHRQPRHAGGRCSPRRASSASTRRRSPRCRRGSASPGSSRRCTRPTTRSSSCEAVIALQARGAVRVAARSRYLRLGEAHDRLGAARAGARRLPRGDRGRRRADDPLRRPRPGAPNGCATRPIRGTPRPIGSRSKAGGGSSTTISRRERGARALARAERARSGRALPLRPRAAGAAATTPRRWRSSSTRSATRAPARRRSSATPTSKRRGSTSAPGARDEAISDVPHRLDALRRRRRDHARRRARAHPTRRSSVGARDRASRPRAP